MEYIGFIITVLILIIVFLQKEKFNLSTIKYTVIAYVASIPIYFLTLLFYKFVLEITPDKSLTIAVYSSFVSIVAIIIVMSLVGIMIQKLLDFQISVGNENKGFIKGIFNKKGLIITLFQTLFFLGGIMGMYGIWIGIN